MALILKYKNILSTTLLLIIASVCVHAQSEYSRLSIRPLLGLGLSFPAKQTQTYGNQPLSYTWKIIQMGSVINPEGKRSFSLNATYRAGLQFNYRLADRVEVFGGGERINLIYSYKHGLGYNFTGRYLNGYYDTFSYWNLMSGLRLKSYNLFYSAALQFQPNVFSNTDRKASKSNVPSNFINQDGTGIRFSESNRSTQRLGLHLGIGQEIEIMNSPGSVELGVNLAFAPIFDEQVDFYQQNALVASTVLNRTINAFFVTFSQALYFKKKEDEAYVHKVTEPLKEEESLKMGDKTVNIGKKLVLNEIQFEQSVAKLSGSAQSALRDVLAFMEDYPKAKVEFSGHTSAEGSRRENIKLSEQRALACKNYLVERGISSKRIRTVGYGPDKPLSNTDQKLNRRVEFQVLSLD